MKRELALKQVAPAKKPMFSVEAVTQRLVRFIAANDQVSFSYYLSLTTLITLLGSVFKCRREP